MFTIPDSLARPLTVALKPLSKVPIAREIVSRIVIDQLASATPPRPRPFSMAADYTTWVSLTDRSFTGRHLEAVPMSGLSNLPSESSIVDLYRREAEVKSTDTSVMFMFFAQWFTDSFLRTDPNDFRKNTSTQEIDLCQLYGLSEDRTQMLRSGKGGRLKSQIIDGFEFPAYLFSSAQPGARPVVKPEFKGLHDEDFLIDVILADAPDYQKESFFAIGLEHGNSTIGTVLLTVVFLREHNRIADILNAEFDWDDERIFQTTRNIMIVLLLKVVVGDYISHITPLDFPVEVVPFIADGKRWNRSNWIAIEFNLLYRWHSMVPDSIETEVGQLDASEFRNNNPLAISAGVDSLMASFSRQRAGKICLANTPSFLVDPTRPGWPSVEERTVALMRQARLRSYNDYREVYGLRRMKSFKELTSDTELRARLESLYGNIDALEWYVGVFAEDYPKNAVMGELLTVMVGNDAFTQALTNPLLAREVYNEQTFSAVGLEIIEATDRLAQIVARNSKSPDSVHVSFKC